MDHPRFYPTTEKAIQGTAVETVVVCNLKSYLPWLKGVAGGLLGKIPHAEKHAPGHLMFDDVMAGARTGTAADANRSGQRPGRDHLHRRHHWACPRGRH